MPMTRRERVLAAVRHQPVDRVPTDIWATGEVTKKLMAHFRTERWDDVREALGIDGIAGAGPRYAGPPPRKEADYYEDEWGNGYRRQDYATGTYFEQVHHPLARAETLADLDAYRWPSPDQYDYSAVAEQAAAAADRAVQCGYSAPFYFHNKLRGLEASLMDPLLRPEFTRHLVRRLSEFFTEYHHRCFEAGRGRVDMTQVTDDWGSQNGLITSRAVFEDFYAAAVQRAIDLAKAFGLFVFHHDDGDMRPLLPRLAGMGIDILNPVQWRCGDWDLPALKAEFGARLCFHGGIDNQQTLPFGTPAQVRDEVRRVVGALAADRTGFILAPCHNLQAVTPVENIVAMYEAAREFGTFAP